jgi:hypothetical protein
MARTRPVRARARSPRSQDDTSARSDRTRAARRTRFVAAVVGLVATLLYARTIGFSYTLDDASAVTENHLTQAGIKAVPALFTTSYRAGYDPSLDDGLYRPLSLVVLAVEWQTWPNRPGAYHAVNALLYGVVTALLVLTIVRFLGPERDAPTVVAGWAGLAALLYAAHPIHTEVVASIKSLDEILAALFLLVAVRTALLARRTDAVWGDVVLIGVASLLAVLAKESAVIVVVVAPLAVWWRDGASRRVGRVAAGAFAGTAAAFVLRLLALGSRWSGPASIDPFDNILASAPDVATRVASASALVWHDVRLLVVPHPLVFDYSPWATSLVTWRDPHAWLGVACLVGLVVACLLIARRRDRLTTPARLAALGATLLLVSLIPVSNLFVLIGTAMAERLLFVPSMGVVCLIAAGLAGVAGSASSGRRWGRTVALVVGVLVVTAGAAATWAREAAWRNDTILFETDAEISPSSARLQYDLGLALVRDQLPAATSPDDRAAVIRLAIEHLREALRLWPTYPDADNELGVALEADGQHDEAVAAFRRALAQGPLRARYFNNLGVALMSLRQFSAAADAYRSATSVDPADASAWLNFGTALGSAGDYPGAIDALLRSDRLEPGRATTYRNLAVTYRRMGDEATAAAYQARAEAAAGAGS